MLYYTYNALISSLLRLLARIALSSSAFLSPLSRESSSKPVAARYSFCSLNSLSLDVNDESCAFFVPHFYFPAHVKAMMMMTKMKMKEDDERKRDAEMADCIHAVRFYRSRDEDVKTTFVVAVVVADEEEEDDQTTKKENQQQLQQHPERRCAKTRSHTDFSSIETHALETTEEIRARVKVNALGLGETSYASNMIASNVTWFDRAYVKEKLITKDLKCSSSSSSKEGGEDEDVILPDVTDVENVTPDRMKRKVTLSWMPTDEMRV